MEEHPHLGVFSLRCCPEWGMSDEAFWPPIDSMRCMPFFPYGSPRLRQRGTSLVEVLVAVVVLSTGLMGMAGLLHGGVRFNHAAYLRTQGTGLAADMLERLRAQQPACLVADAQAPCGLITDDGQDASASAGQACGEPLPAAALPGAELQQWKSCLARWLPDGRGRVSRLAEGVPYTDRCGSAHAPAPVPLFVVEVHWAERRLTTAGEAGRECVVLRTRAGA